MENQITAQDFLERLKHGLWTTIRVRGVPTRIPIRTAGLEENDVLKIEGGKHDMFGMLSGKPSALWHWQTSYIQIRESKDPSILKIVRLTGKMYQEQLPASQGGGSCEVPAYQELLAVKVKTEEELEEEESLRNDREKHTLLKLIETIKTQSVGKTVADIQPRFGCTEMGQAQIKGIKMVFSDETSLSISMSYPECDGWGPHGLVFDKENPIHLDQEIFS